MAHALQLDITHFGVAETLHCSAGLKVAAIGRPTVEGVARAVCDYFFDALVDAKGRPATVLARFYVTATFAQLPSEEQHFARQLLRAGISAWPELRCLTLLGTRGAIASWNNRHLSKGHRAIPLPSPAVVEEAPMIAQLFKQMGASIADIVAPPPEMLAGAAKTTYNVFHVPEAKGSPHIPAQAEFVEQHGVRSVVGFGGALPWGEHFAVILFSRAPISQVAASRFRTLALDVRSTLRDFDASQLFEKTVESTTPTSTGTNVVPAAIELTRSRDATTFREFTDPNGVHWSVWAIVPSIAEISSLTTKRFKTRRRTDDSWQKGWLLFESPAESRRLRPIPDNWQQATLTDLAPMCRSAEPVPRAVDK